MPTMEAFAFALEAAMTIPGMHTNLETSFEFNPLTDRGVSCDDMVT